MQTLTYTDLQPRHTLAAPALARELVVLEHPEEWHSARPGDIVLGSGSNIVFCGEVRERLLHPVFSGCEVVGEDAASVFLQVRAGTPWHEVVKFVVAQGWYGAENLALIPGTAGAAPVQNIGAYGVEIQNILTKIQVYDLQEGSFHEIAGKDCGFRYRYSHLKGQWRQRYCISALTLRLHKQAKLQVQYPGLNERAEALSTPHDVFNAVVTLRQSKLPDPDILPNAGSFFHNPLTDGGHFARLQRRFPNMPYFESHGQIKIPAAWCIEQCGFKGVIDGRVGIYDKHALILINHGATGAEILAFAAKIQQAVFKRFGLQLQIEPTIIGEPYDCHH